jgi:putative inorganic carbon (hco3(-)) transporter
MRDALLAAIIAILLIAGLIRPIIGVYAYTWFALMRPDVLAFSPPRPYSQLLAVVALIGALRSFYYLKRVVTNSNVWLVAVLYLCILMSIVLAPNTAEVLPQFDLLSRALLMAVLIPLMVGTEIELRILLCLMGLSLGVVGIKYGLFGLVSGGARFSQGYGGMITDNNDMALAFNMSIPFLWFMLPKIPWRSIQLVFLGFIFCTMVAVVMTFSRGGALTLGFIMLLALFYSKNRLIMLALFAVMSLPGVVLVGKQWLDRISTIAVPTREASANSRFELIRVAFKVWQESPISGVGFGGVNFREAAKKYTILANKDLVAHNTYMQMLADCGILAFFVFIALLWGNILWLGLSSRRMAKDFPDLACYPRAIQASLVAFAVGGAVLSRTQFDYLYIVLMAAAAWFTIEKQTYRSAAFAQMTRQDAPEEAPGTSSMEAA